MANLGFIGLGIMGYPMARNLCRAGHQVRVWSHTASKAERLAGEEPGATACESPAAAAEGSECVFVCVGNTEMSRGVLLGPDGVISGAAEGTVVADASTISAAASHEIAEALSAKGIDMLDSPCTGSKLGSENAKLTFMVGGERPVFDKVRPFFDPMAQQVYYCGGPGMGLRVKLAQNLIQSNILQAFNEGIVLAAKTGVDPALMVDIINNTAARAGLIEFKAPYIFARDFATHFSVKWMHKDIGLAMELASDNNVPVPITSVTRQMYAAAIARGYSDDDFASVIKVLEEITGVEVKKS